MQRRLRVDGDIFENAPRIDADILYTDKKDAFSKISRIARVMDFEGKDILEILLKSSRTGDRLTAARPHISGYF